MRWARECNGKDTIINCYELDLEGLTVKRFERGGEWFDYIFKNRAGYEDAFGDTDVIIGPIANDTLYDTYGLITSGFLKKEESLKLLMIGPQYIQITVKTERAAAQLKWLSSRILTHSEMAQYRETVRREEQEYQKAFGEGLSMLDSFDEIDDLIK